MSLLDNFTEHKQTVLEKPAQPEVAILHLKSWHDRHIISDTLKEKQIIIADVASVPVKDRPIIIAYIQGCVAALHGHFSKLNNNLVVATTCEIKISDDSNTETIVVNKGLSDDFNTNANDGDNNA